MRTTVRRVIIEKSKASFLRLLSPRNATRCRRNGVRFIGRLLLTDREKFLSYVHVDVFASHHKSTRKKLRKSKSHAAGQAIFVDARHVMTDDRVKL